METDAKLVSDFKGRPGESIFCAIFTGGEVGTLFHKKLEKVQTCKNQPFGNVTLATSFVLQYL